MHCYSPNHKFQEALRKHWGRTRGGHYTEQVFYFLCPGCHKTFCHVCEGNADDMPDHCDTCWYIVFGGEGVENWLYRNYYRARRLWANLKWWRWLRK